MCEIMYPSPRFLLAGQFLCQVSVGRPARGRPVYLAPGAAWAVSFSPCYHRHARTRRIAGPCDPSPISPTTPLHYHEPKSFHSHTHDISSPITNTGRSFYAYSPPAGVSHHVRCACCHVCRGLDGMPRSCCTARHSHGGAPRQHGHHIQAVQISRSRAAATASFSLGIIPGTPRTLDHCRRSALT